MITREDFEGIVINARDEKKDKGRTIKFANLFNLLLEEHDQTLQRLSEMEKMACRQHPGMSCSESHADDAMKIADLDKSLAEAREIADVYKFLAIDYSRIAAPLYLDHPVEIEAQKILSRKEGK